MTTLRLPAFGCRILIAAAVWAGTGMPVARAATHTVDSAAFAYDLRVSTVPLVSTHSADSPAFVYDLRVSTVPVVSIHSADSPAFVYDLRIVTVPVVSIHSADSAAFVYDLRIVTVPVVSIHSADSPAFVYDLRIVTVPVVSIHSADSAAFVYDLRLNTVPAATPYTFTTLAGTALSPGTADGTGSAAQFYSPVGVAVDSAGNVYVADQGNHAIRKITNGGVVTTLAGTAGSQGSTDGTGSAARFSYPRGMAVDNAGNVYVADANNHTIRKITSGGVVTTLAGLAGSQGATDGTGSAARFFSPQAVAVDSTGNVYVADTDNHTIRKITSAGVVTTLAGLAANDGSADGSGNAARFNGPFGVAVDGAGTVFVTDSRNFTLRQITSAGVVTTLAGTALTSGSADGTGSAARFNFPMGVAVDSAGNVYVADYNNHTIRQITIGGVVTTLAGMAGSPGLADGAGSATRFYYPWSVAVDSASNVYVADSGNHTIRKGILAPFWLTSATTASGTVGQNFNTIVTFSGAVTGFSASGLPAGLSLDATTGVISGTPTTAGTFTITLGATNGAGSATGTLTLTVAAATAKTSQTITFGALANKTYGDAPFTVSATASSGLAPTFSIVSGPATINGSTVTLTGVGTVVVRAAQAGDVNYAAAAEVDQSFAITEGIIYATPYTFATLAGTAGSIGSTDDIGSAARFYVPTGVAVDSAGNVYLAEAYNHTIRKITGGGVVTTLAGTAGSAGAADGTGSAARFNTPYGVAVDDAGNVYVADSGNSTIRKITSGGEVTTLAGLAGSPGAADGTGSVARFNGPFGVAVDGAGNVFVTDSGNFTVRQITSSGVVTTLAGTALTSGSTDGTGSAARFWYPLGVAVDLGGNVYVADSSNCTIRQITSSGVVTTLAGTAGYVGMDDGTGSAARFWNPYSVAVDSAGNVYVADSGNHTMRRIASGGVVTTLAGLAGSPGAVDGTGSAARFNIPYGVAVDRAGNVYVTDQYSHTLRWGALEPPALTSSTRISGIVGQNFDTTVTFSGALTGFSASGLPAGLSLDAATGVISGRPTTAGVFPLTFSATNGAGTGTGTRTLTISVESMYGTPYTFTTLAGTALISGPADGTGSAARFNSPVGVAVDSAGNVYVADMVNHAIRKITNGGVVTTLAGTAGSPGAADGTGSAARFNYPRSVAVDNAGNIYVADANNHTIRKITSGGVVTTLAGTAGSQGATDGTGSAARFSSPEGVAVDSTGNVYVADSGNHAIRKITSAGVVTTLAGMAANDGSADGTGSAARFNSPMGVAVDSAGNVYVADTVNQTIRKITSGGVVTTLAGTALVDASSDGTGSAAWFNYPISLAVDSAGNVYVADDNNYTIRKITSGGVVTTLAGAVLVAGSSDGTGSAASFRNPFGVAVDSAGNLYVADMGNHTIRKGSLAPLALTSAIAASGSVGQNFNYIVTFSGAVTGFSASGLPAGLSLDAATGVISGTPTTAGTFTVTLGATNGAGSATGTLTLTVAAATAKTSQTITFGALANKTVGDAPFTVSATASSGLAPTYSIVSGPATIGGSTVTLTGAGTVVVRAAQAGNASYEAAPEVDRSFTVAAGGTSITPYTFTTLAGTALISGAADAFGSAARFDSPAGMAVDRTGNVYVADGNNHTIRKITSGGLVTTLAGSAGSAGSADGTGGVARFNAPQGVAVDGAGNVYVADYNNSTIRKITSGGVVTTLAGTALNPGSTDGIGSAARFNAPIGLAVDSTGNVYVADSSNRTVRKITGAGVVTTLAGTTGSLGSVDGIGSAARFSTPMGVAVDSAGNVYVADYNNHTIRQITSAGVVTTLAGTAGSLGSADGIGIAARFHYPLGVAVDSAGNVYVADSGNQSIRIIAGGAVVTTLAGTPGMLGSADGSGSVARFNTPYGVAVDSAGNVYVADQYNHTIRWGALVPPALTSAGAASGIVGQSFNTIVTFSGALTGFSASGLPAGLSLDPATGVVSGTPTAAGTFTVTLGATNGAGSATGTLTLTVAGATAKTSQTITFGALANKTYGDAPFTVSATASSGLAPTFSIVSGPATISGSTVTITGAGIVVVRAAQAGNGNYEAAPEVDRSFTVAAVGPSITTQPVPRTAAINTGVTFNVVATGSGPLSYQWRKNGSNLAYDSRITGATTATLSIANLALTDAGDYSVAVSNTAGGVTSNAAALTVVDAQATHRVVVAGQPAGSTVTITNTLSYAGTATALNWQVLPPAGWSYASGSGSEGTMKPSVGATNLLEWGWPTVPASPMTFTYTLNVPAGQSGNQTLAGLVSLRLQGLSADVPILAQPDPLVVSPATTHSADTDRNFRFHLNELTRVIELYNTRNGTVRTGCYKVQNGTEDGFTLELAREGPEVVTLASYHSADTDRDGKIGILELTRVIELYNYRSGTVRTGAYRVQASTEDGFAPGP